MVTLARKLRPDIHVGVRVLQIKQAVDKIGPDLLRLEGYYCLCAVQLPHNIESIEAEGLTDWERHQRRSICNQIDLSPTAQTEHPSTEKPEVAARLALGETCGIEVSDILWEQKVQAGLRRRLEVELTSSFKDANGANVSVLLLPDDAVATKIHGVLCFSEAPGADYEAKKAPGAKPAATPGAAGAKPAATPAKADGDETQIQGKTIRQWEAEQAAEFSHLPKLPSNWLRVKSRKTGEVYFFNKRTQEATFDMPESDLPPGWSKQVSKSTGKTYYFNAHTKGSTFERPTA